MHSAALINEAPEPDKPHRSFGSGKIIGDDCYGHVDVSVIPRRDSADLMVEWKVVGGSIPSEQRELVIAASQHVLDSAALQGQLRCGVHLIIESGSYHDQLRPAHVEAAERAITDALRRGNFLRKV
jgi:hypothetical protein